MKFKAPQGQKGVLRNCFEDRFKSPDEEPRTRDPPNTYLCLILTPIMSSRVSLCFPVPRLLRHGFEPH